jgi:hypothetical protein
MSIHPVTRPNPPVQSNPAKAASQNRPAEKEPACINKHCCNKQCSLTALLEAAETFAQTAKAVFMTDTHAGWLNK